jgi:nucleoside-diphosphate-sugar epimerase
MKVCVTGAAGYIGSRLVEQLQNIDCVESIYAFDNLRYNQGELVYPLFHNSNKVVFFKDDITLWSSTLKEAIAESDVIIPLAALVGAPLCNDRPQAATAINFKWFESLLPYLKNQLVVYPNTNSGYGTTGEEVCTEQTPSNPISHYAKTKQDAENLLLQNHKHKHQLTSHL